MREAKIYKSIKDSKASNNVLYFWGGGVGWGLNNIVCNRENKPLPGSLMPWRSPPPPPSVSHLVLQPFNRFPDQAGRGTGAQHRPGHLGLLPIPAVVPVSADGKGVI